MGGPGVHRSIRFVSHLRDFGYEPVVLTILEDDIINLNAVTDFTLMDKIPDNIQIHRTSSGTPFSLNNWLIKFKIYRLFWFFLYPLFWEKSALWPSIAIKKALQIIDDNQIDIIYTSSGPFSSLKLGYNITKKRDVKWVADLRDPYTDAYAWSYPSKLHWYLSRFNERRWIRRCHRLIVNTPEVKKLYIKRQLKKESDITVITNGY